MSLWNGEHLPKHVKDNDLNNALEACRLLTTKPDSKIMDWGFGILKYARKNIMENGSYRSGG